MERAETLKRYFWRFENTRQFKKSAPGHKVHGGLEKEVLQRESFSTLTSLWHWPLPYSRGQTQLAFNLIEPTYLAQGWAGNSALSDFLQKD